MASDNVDDSKTWGGDELEDWLLGKSKRKAKEDGMDLADPTPATHSILTVLKAGETS